MRSTILITAFIASALADYDGTPQECAVKCTTAHNACLVKPDTNRAQCASEYAACLGYNPYENGFVQPTACSKTTAAPTQTKPPPPHHDECKCYDEYNKCRGAPGAHMSYCGSQYADCLGYNPFDGHHDPEEIAKKCSKPIITPPPLPPKPDCHRIDKCGEERDKCRGKPGANQAECAAEWAKCLGFNPSSPDGERYIKECEEEHHKPPHNGTAPPVHPTNPPIISGGSVMKPWEVFSYLAAAVAAFL